MNLTPLSASTDNEELKKFVNGWLIEVAFGVYDREDLPRLADKLISEIANHTKEAERRARIDEAQIAAASYENSDSYPGIGKRLYDRLAELAAPAVHKTDMEGGGEK